LARITPRFKKQALLNSDVDYDLITGCLTIVLLTLQEFQGLVATYLRYM